MDAGVKPFERLLAGSVNVALDDTPVVCILGARQCGKSTLARTLKPRYAYVSFDDEAALAFARDDPTGFISALPGKVILDEVQRVPELLRAIKLSVDRERSPGRFLLTGSANLLMMARLGDSLAGRMQVIELQPLTAAELARAPGEFLAAMIAGRLKPAIAGKQADSAQALAARVVAGGFPEAAARPHARARAWHREYLRSLVERDVQEITRVHDAREVGRLLELLALRTAELLNLSSLGNDLDLRRETVENYLGICERLYLVRRLQPWHRNASKRLIKTPKVHLVDSGLAATMGGLGVTAWSTQRERFGHLLESFVLQQLIAQAGWTDADLRFWHYRDKDQVEVDVVITRGRETWGVEIKSSSTVTPVDGQGLRRLAEQCGKDFRGGVLLHAGTDTFRVDTANCVAAPLSLLWDM